MPPLLQSTPPTSTPLSDPLSARALAGGGNGKGEGKGKGKAKRKFHRCRVHTSHTCWRATTCKHRNHKPAGQDGGQGDGGKGDQPKGNQTKPPSTTKDPTPQPTPTPLPASPLPTAFGLHLGSRFSYGVTPELHREMEAAGGPQAWFAAQLDPARIADPVGDQFLAWWPSLDLDAPTIWQRDQAGTEPAWEVMADYQRWCLLRRVWSRRQVLEQLTEFFENHLHVPVHDDGVFGFRSAYGKLIRSHALGRFDEMLTAAITHPAMGISLDNATSTKRAPNENLGRELLELHTVGRGNYTEDDVKASARILTGYRVQMWSTWRDWYDPASHWTGPVQVMGFSHPNTDPDGRAVTAAYLSYLAHHPATATRLCRKLAVRFVSDDPSPALVDHLARVYLASDTAIAPVLQALVAHPEFAASAGAKVRTPTDDVVATWRALGVQLARPTGNDSAADAILWQTTTVGAEPHNWPRPDGQPERGAAWSSASRVLASFQMHYAMSGTWWPKRDLTYRPLASWAPVTDGAAVRFDDLVEHLSRSLLCRPASARVQEAARLQTGLTAGTVITAGHALVRWGMPGLISTLLDSPEHLTR